MGASVLRRADCSVTNRLQHLLPGPSTTQAVPSGALYTWQLLAEDSYQPAAEFKTFLASETENLAKLFKEYDIH